jgi:hypothetical protein
MLQHLLELLLNAKSGVIAGVFLIGTTGALVTATVQNGVTTITITQASASPSASASPTASATASPTATATASPTASPSSSPSSSASANPCADQAHERAAAVQKVNTAFSKFQTALEHRKSSARTDTARVVIENATTMLKEIRQNAVKAIHDTNTCADKDDEDQNEQDEDNDDNDGNKGSHSERNFLVLLLTNLFGGGTTTTVTTTASASPTATASPVVTGSDPQTIADNAVAAMQVVFDTAIAQLPPPTTASPKPHRTPDATDRRHDGKGSDNKGEHGDDND